MTPCKKGHTEGRYASGHCKVCERARIAARRAHPEVKERQAQTDAAWAAANKERKAQTHAELLDWITSGHYAERFALHFS